MGHYTQYQVHTHGDYIIAYWLTITASEALHKDHTYSWGSDSSILVDQNTANGGSIKLTVYIPRIGLPKSIGLVTISLVIFLSTGHRVLKTII